MKLFVRQPFTQASEREQRIVASILQLLRDQAPSAPEFLTGATAESKESFRTAFEDATGKPFTPANFRHHRLSLLKQADAFINIRTAMSESTAFEIAFNIFGGRNVPMLFLIWDQADIKTTLIRELHDIADVTYYRFSNPAEAKEDIARFLNRVAERAADGKSHQAG